jgi:hypothetical protein
MLPSATHFLRGKEDPYGCKTELNQIEQDEGLPHKITEHINNTDTSQPEAVIE